MKKFSEILLESVKKVSDTKMDDYLKGKDVLSFGYNAEAVMELGKSCDVYVSQDRKFFHITKPLSQKTNKVLQELNLVEVK